MAINSKKPLVDRFKAVNSALYANDPDMKALVDAVAVENFTISKITNPGTTTPTRVIDFVAGGLFGFNQTYKLIDMAKSEMHDLTTVYNTLDEIQLLNSPGLYQLGVVSDIPNVPNPVGAVAGAWSGYKATASSGDPLVLFLQELPVFQPSQGNWASNQNGFPHWIKIEYPAPTRVLKYNMVRYYSADGRQPSYWKIQGSNNDTDWTDLHVVENSLPGVFSIPSDKVGDYKFYRMLISATQDRGIYQSAALTRWWMYGTKPSLVSIVPAGQINANTFLPTVKAQLRQHLKYDIADDEFSVDLTTPTSPIVNVASVSFYGAIKVAEPKVEVQPGEVILDDTAITTWTVPDGVSSISVVAVATGNAPWNDVLGQGGGLSYRNNILVTPGEVLTVMLPTLNQYSADCGLKRGETILVASKVGVGSNADTKGGLGGKDAYAINDGGGNGGVWTMSSRQGGSAGAGGYSGNGGNGGYERNGYPGTGGGGGGSYMLYNAATNGVTRGRGGGVGLFGIGDNGAGGTAGSVDGKPGSGGVGSVYGGGGNMSKSGIRIIWGAGRSFPSNAT